MSPLSNQDFDIVLFDGVCNLCNQAVDFIIQHDSKNHFKLASLQDEPGKALLKGKSIDEAYLDSIVLLRKNKVYYKSRAALEIAKKLKGLWPLFYGFIIVPQFLRDPVYDWIAKNRYKWFGKRDTCRLPNEREKRKFLSTDDFIK
ncbi:thiol-disulfide oxidoreductase DCC family protein [Echinicola marina]|uniref:thiol-disulfide oxidoreductase DCC family protein n=1 Tax=Echinicola marina TaxID=2859768 RepID=UPI001CF66C07|nr:thiol-disulfide oxidoreductase DCC family protein [Echinicola marina]UCS93119.1 thiol-disulfide oxidoreductase DCC family protein [Echinicola marina]